MASKTVVELFDDLDGGHADETVTFALDGVDYEIDLSSANATELRGMLSEYISHAHRAPVKAAKRKEAVVERVARTEHAEKPAKPKKAGKPVHSDSASMTAEIRRLASESARKASEAAAAKEAEEAAAETFEVSPLPIQVPEPGTERQQEPRALVIPFQEAGL